MAERSGRPDDPTNLMHINGVLVLDQPVDFESIRDVIERRLLAIPRFRNRVVVPKRGRPYWEPDPDFHIAHHVGHLALPEPGGDADLREVVERLISEPFDPAHPMWRFEVVQNFRGGTVVMAKLHHCMGDGVALMLVLLSLTDRTPQADPAAPNPFLSLYACREEDREKEGELDLDTILVDDDSFSLGAVGGAHVGPGIGWYVGACQMLHPVADAGAQAKCPVFHVSGQQLPVGLVYVVTEGVRNDTAVVGAGQPGDHVDEGGLAGAVRAQQAEELARRHREAHPGERAQRAEALLDVADLYGVQRSGVAPGATGSRASTP